MFSFFKKNDCSIYAPATGKIINIEEVPDEMFSKKMMGEGIGFIFEGDLLCSPVDGKVSIIACTKHAIGFETQNGAEILMHIGLDTVNLKGQGFEVLVTEGDKVSHGKPIIKINRKFMIEKKIDMITPIVITNAGFDIDFEQNTDVNTDSILMKCFKK